MTEHISHSENETEDIAARLAPKLKGGTAVAFTGGLGMGKTAFVRGCVRALGNDAFVSSPTFAIVNDYGGKPHLYHFDMYRISGEDDLFACGFYDYQTPDSILFIEWSENITEYLPPETVFVNIKNGSDTNERIISIEGEDF